MNKRIFTYWHQGFDKAPEIARACVRSAGLQNDSWEIVCLDEHSSSEWIDPIPIPQARWSKIGLAHRSDLIRTQLLIKYGGVWADPTVWFCRPLDDWLPDLMEAGLFMFQRPGRDRAISNWFIAAEPQNQLLERLYEKLCAYWTTHEFVNFDRQMPRSGRILLRVLSRNRELSRLWLKAPIIRLFRCFPYMIYHYTLYDLVRRDSHCEEIWKQMPPRLADGPHKLLRAGLLETASESVKAVISSRQDDLYKLTWKLPSSRVPEGSVLDCLIKTGSLSPFTQA